MNETERSAAFPQDLCPLCHGDGRCLTECCNGSFNCPCRGDVVDLGPCRGCGGSGMRSPQVDLDANLRVIRSACSPDGYIRLGAAGYTEPSAEGDQ